MKLLVLVFMAAIWGDIIGNLLSVVVELFLIPIGCGLITYFHKEICEFLKIK